MTIETLTPEVPRVPDLFPIGRKPVIHTFAELDKVGGSWGDLLKVEKVVMSGENPAALAYLEDLADRYEGEEALGFNAGTALAYAVFQEKARGLPIPNLTDDFIEIYNNAKAEHFLRAYNGNRKAMAHGAGQEHGVRLNLFRLMERDCYDALDSNLKVKGEDAGVLTENFLFFGFVYTYFLFREGLSSPANWESA